MLPSFSKWDAIGNEAVIVRSRLRELGIHSEIYCLQGFESGEARDVRTLKRDLDGLTGDRAVIYHFSVGSDLTRIWRGLPGRKILRYHNITPAQFFTRPDELHARHVCNLGRVQMPLAVEASHALLSDSRFNAAELERFRGAQPSSVVPVLRDYGRLTSLKTSESLAASLSARDVRNILFVGRVAPNKSQHDILQLIALFKQKSQRPVRAIIAGGFFSKSYQSVIHKFAAGLGLGFSDHWDMNADVICVGSISDEEMATLYRTARVFLSMSEHEGFGVPIVESMYFDLPVVAHRATAVPEVLGESAAFLMDKFNWDHAVETLSRALEDDVARAAEIKRCQKTREAYQLESCWQKFRESLGLGQS
jgi:glycosyltransferase involved in cell wall biosynthesis